MIEQPPQQSRIRTAMLCCRWIGRLIVIGYTGFFLFMLIGHLIPDDEPFGTLTTQEALGFLFIGTWFLGLWLAWKFEDSGAVTALLSLVGFRATITIAFSFIACMALPCLFFLAAAILQRRNRPGSKTKKDKNN